MFLCQFVKRDALDSCYNAWLMRDLPHFFDQTPASLAELVQRWAMPAYRADQLFEWVYQKGVTNPQRMTNLSEADRRTIEMNLCFLQSKVIYHQQATDGTQKLLLQWQPMQTTQTPATLDVQSNADRTNADAETRVGTITLPTLQRNSQLETECVMIPSLPKRDLRKGVTNKNKAVTNTHAVNKENKAFSTPDITNSIRRTACISSQIGCPVGCRFCASGLGGLDGNLTAGQIVEQVWLLNQLPDVPRISHIVFMGMGEPLSNFDQVTKAIRMLMADWAMGISGRKITLSTVGLPAQIRRLAELDLPITLAISLHAPNDDIRRKLIPWAEYVTIDQLLAAGQYYFRKTGREVTLEYTLIASVNDRPENARQLAQIARKLRSNINLIRYNEVPGLPFGRPEDEVVRRFQKSLRQAGINVHIRASRGRDIAAACGQLRHENRT